MSNVNNNNDGNANAPPGDANAPIWPPVYNPGRLNLLAPRAADVARETMLRGATILRESGVGESQSRYYSIYPAPEASQATAGPSTPAAPAPAPPGIAATIMFACPYCATYLDDAQHLREHLEREHDGTQHNVELDWLGVDPEHFMRSLFRCPHCSGAVATLENLAHHLQTADDPTRALPAVASPGPFQRTFYQCPYCPTSLCTPAEFVDHVGTMHGPPYAQ